jgi:hypothetical protein
MEYDWSIEIRGENGGGVWLQVSNNRVAVQGVIALDRIENRRYFWRERVK